MRQYGNGDGLIDGDEVGEVRAGEETTWRWVLVLEVTEKREVRREAY
jgi:hypothetical protein